MVGESGFGLSEPHLILSVTGGVEILNVNEEVRSAFKLGLMKITKTTNSWIISGGLNAGVMELVGDAVVEDLDALHTCTILGIASWGIIANRNQLLTRNFDADSNCVRYIPQKKTSDQKTISLNPNHNRFIFVDDGSVDKLGIELEFRTDMEDLLKKKFNIPMVMIVFEGDFSTLNAILLGLIKRTPVILVAVSI
jgi:hypothetical protein